MPTFQPAYIETFQNGLLKTKSDNARKRLQCCDLCPRKCRVNRLEGETGVCRTGKVAIVSSYNPHFGEETPLVGRGGSGTIFFTHCNLLCNFCQNYDISHEGNGHAVSADQLADIMLKLQESGCHNINFVTPSHVVPQILDALAVAIPSGLSLPLVYNSGGYDRVSTLQMLQDVFDIYMPDFKFWDPEVAEKTCQAKDYPVVARKALKEMHRQVGDLVIDSSQLALKGLMVRHLVLPGGLAGTREIMHFMAKHLSTNTFVNIMPQYRPCGRAAEVKALAGQLSNQEYTAAIQAAEAEGLTRLDQRRRVFMMW